MPEPSHIPVASHACVSADTRRDERGVQDQHKLNRATAARHGWTVVHEFTDNDKSAAKADVVRDDIEAMLKARRSASPVHVLTPAGPAIGRCTAQLPGRPVSTHTEDRKRKGEVREDGAVEH
ncbi:recombinase family protein [Microtetraspora malaysiensis]|uniref:recombinase family protein n=1 Tax=Microtetraspora malaysiensis TaxID=161358 RepID=UPI000A401BE7